MRKHTLRWLGLTGLWGLCSFCMIQAASYFDYSDVTSVITGTSAFTDYSKEKPGVFRKITVADLPKPYATEGVSNSPTLVPKPDNAWPQALPGFKVERYAENLHEPREIRIAPNGDLFVAESRLGQVLAFRGITGDGKPQKQDTTAAPSTAARSSVTRTDGAAARSSGLGR